MIKLAIKGFGRMERLGLNVGWQHPASVIADMVASELPL